MKNKNGNNKIERQINYLKNYLSIKVKVESNHYFIVDNKKKVNDIYITNKQPRLIDGRFGRCYLFEFENGNLFAPCWAVCFTRNELNQVLIKTQNQNWKNQAIGCDDFCALKDVDFDIKIRINSENCGWKKAQKAINNCYGIKPDYDIPELEKIN